MFKKDLAREQDLHTYLDGVYQSLGLDVDRIEDIKLQLKGVDLIYKGSRKAYYIDEKAQLHYINKDLPTFTFELDFLLYNVPKIGWFLDQDKITTHYFLITAIKSNKKNEIKDVVESLRITSVHRAKLQSYLSSVGLHEGRLLEYVSELRKYKVNGKHSIAELKALQGCLYASGQLSEYPINLQLRLSWLVDIGVAKVIYPVK